jgi:hypothetical protein
VSVPLTVNVLARVAVAGALAVSLVTYLRGSATAWNSMEPDIPVSTNSLVPSADQAVKCPPHGIHAPDRLRALAGAPAPPGKT